MAILDSVSDETSYEPILGSSDEEMRRRAVRGPLRPGSILGNPISPIMNSGAPIGDRPILGSGENGAPLTVNPRPKLIALNGDGSPYARMTEASSQRGIAEQARNAPILGRSNDEPGEGILGRGTKDSMALTPPNFYAGAESRPEVPSVTPPAIDVSNPLGTGGKILGRGAETDAGGILGVKPQPSEGPATTRYRELLEQGAPKYHGVNKFLDILGNATTIGQAIETGTGIGSLGYRARVARAGKDAAGEFELAKEPVTLDYERARTEEQQAKADQERAKANALRNPQPRADRTIPPETDDYYSLLDQTNPATGKNFTSQEALEQVKGAGKQDRQLTNAFEAFAYGTPEQKQSAKDFIDYEKKVGARYRTPNEFDLRYKLFKEDPETYRAMFGDRGQASDDRNRIADREHATSMLKFFQRQRDEISKNFMLGDDEKAQKLQEIDEMEKPFKDAAAMDGAGGGGDRVNVIGPDGTPGTVPRSQLGAAKRKGYRVAQ